MQIANRIKAKGLQKLRWYCQMCGKQCRDENGFKCHLSSDSHQRQMMVFGQVRVRLVLSVLHVSRPSSRSPSRWCFVRRHRATHFHVP